MRGMARARCQELEQELTAWEFRLTPLDDQLANLRFYLTDHLGRLDRAVQSLTAGSYRRKAAVVGELFDQIVLHFRQVKAEKQVRSKFLPNRTEFKVSVMDVTSPRSLHHFRGPAPQEGAHVGAFVKESNRVDPHFRPADLRRVPPGLQCRSHGF